jgi:hypothetical protein
MVRQPKIKHISYLRMYISKPDNYISPFILSCHHSLFTQKTLEQRLLTTYDNLQCWSRSVNEAMLVQKLMLKQNGKMLVGSSPFLPRMQVPLALPPLVLPFFPRLIYRHNTVPWPYCHNCLNNIGVLKGFCLTFYHTYIQ